MTCLFNISETPVKECSIITDTEFGWTARTITLRLSYPRFILPQMAKHRVFAQTTRSSRYTDIGEDVYKNSNVPIELFTEQLEKTIAFTNALKEMGVAREIYNRFLEPFAYTDQILTLDWRDLDHFLMLRLANEAQWEMRELATAIMLAVSRSEPIHTNVHIPFACYYSPITLDTIKRSLAKVARISRSIDLESKTLKEDQKRFEFIMSNRHFSVLEHLRYEGENVRFLGEKQAKKKYDRENDVNDNHVFESIFEEMVKNVKVWR